jgi:hypothetical protein
MEEKIEKVLYLEEEAEADPLIILDVFLVGLVSGRPVDARMRDFEADLLEVGTVNRVGRMDPAVGVEDVLGDILGVDAVDGVADVLSRRHDETERQQNHHRDAVVQPEDGRVYVDVADFDEILQTPEYVQHGGRSLGFHAVEEAAAQV